MSGSHILPYTRYAHAVIAYVLIHTAVCAKPVFLGPSEHSQQHADVVKHDIMYCLSNTEQHKQSSIQEWKTPSKPTACCL